MSTKIYLDHAAATPMDKSVAVAMEAYFTDKFYNPSALYLAAKEVSEDIEEARGKIANILGARSSEIIFTAGGSEANNLALRGVIDRNPGSNMLVSSIEHDSILAPAKIYEHKVIPVKKDGIIDPESVKKQIDENTILVSIMLANNEIGTIQPIKDVAKIIAKERAKRARQMQNTNNALPIYLHTDACQAANYLDLHVSRLGVDLMTLNGGKIYGPKQSGVLYIRTGTDLSPLVYGGGQERGLRSGTENAAGIAGFSRALEMVQARRQEESERLTHLRDYFIERVTSEIEGASVNGSQKKRIPNNVHVTFEGQDNERIVMGLDERGIICAAGSACSASNDKPSHVLEAIGLDENQAQSSIRFTMGASTTREDIDKTLESLKSIIK